MSCKARMLESNNLLSTLPARILADNDRPITVTSHRLRLAATLWHQLTCRSTCFRTSGLQMESSRPDRKLSGGNTYWIGHRAPLRNTCYSHSIDPSQSWCIANGLDDRSTGIATGQRRDHVTELGQSGAKPGPSRINGGIRRDHLGTTPDATLGRDGDQSGTRTTQRPTWTTPKYRTVHYRRRGDKKLRDTTRPAPNERVVGTDRVQTGQTSSLQSRSIAWFAEPTVTR